MRYFISLLLLFSISACKKDEDKPDSTTTTTSIEFLNPVCLQTPFPANDGYKTGFVWKPESESNGNLVVLLPGNFTQKFSNCFVKLRYGEQESMSWAGFSNYDGAHNDRLRQTWRASKPGKSYAHNSDVTCVDHQQTCKWRIKWANERND